MFSLLSNIIDPIHISLGIIILGIMLLIIDLSINKSFGFDIELRDMQWAGLFFLLSGSIMYSVKTCSEKRY